MPDARVDAIPPIVASAPGSSGNISPVDWRCFSSCLRVTPASTVTPMSYFFSVGSLWMRESIRERNALSDDKSVHAESRRSYREPADIAADRQAHRAAKKFTLFQNAFNLVFQIDIVPADFDRFRPHHCDELVCIRSRADEDTGKDLVSIGITLHARERSVYFRRANVDKIRLTKKSSDER